MLENLLEVELAYNMFKATGEGNIDPIDSNYAKLKTTIEVSDNGILLFLYNLFSDYFIYFYYHIRYFMI